MEIEIKNLKGEKAGTIDVPEFIFNEKWRPELIHQVVVAQDANARVSWAHTKDRGEVSGGGRKPWRQKGTGRARHGSIRSPLWIGGGVTFGPRKEKDYSKKINKKMRKKAVFSALSKKFMDGEVIVIDGFGDVIKQGPKTKTFSQILSVLVSGESATIVFSEANKDLHKFVRNLEKISYLSPTSMNAKDILRSKHILIEKEAINDMIRHYNRDVSDKETESENNNVETNNDDNDQIENDNTKDQEKE